MMLPTGDRRGFTLVELAVVVFILATLMMVAMPNFVRSYQGAKVNSAARGLATACQLTRLQAATHQQEVQLRLDLDRRQWWIVIRQEDSELVLKAADLPDGVAILAALVGDESLQRDGQINIRFFPNGTCDPAAVVLQGNDKSETLELSLDPVTAKADVKAVKG